MADTKRTKSEIATLLADNTAGNIGAQDHRDFLESMDVSRGAFYWTAFATTTLTSQGTAVAGGTNRLKILGTTTSKTGNRFTHANNRLTYTGTPNIKADIFAQFCGSVDAATQDLTFELYLNGAYLIGSYMLQRFATSGAPYQVCVFGESTLSTSDFIELFVANTTSAGKILTPIAGYVNIQEIPLG